MSAWAIVGIIVVVLVALAAVGLFVWNQRRRNRLRERFGGEYDRAVEQSSGRRAAEKELQDREKKHNELQLKPLSPAAHQHYTESWARVQQQFVDQPAAAVTEADRVITSLMKERGYPTDQYDERVSYLSVEHSGTLERYRKGHAIMMRQREQEVSTEDLRNAMLHHRTLFQELLDDAKPQERPHERIPQPRAQDAPTDRQSAQPMQAAHPMQQQYPPHQQSHQQAMPQPHGPQQRR